ncbi:MAG TPA: VOC family protein [Stellaceae bacterium]|nr:VOC family protein [Stellaceae bacterium]
MPSAAHNPIRPLGVGEVVVRVADLQLSIGFYRDVLGFELIRVLHEAIAFMRVADGVEGHTQIIGLFSREWPSSRERKMWDGADPRLSTLHHFAIEISLSEYDRVLQYLRSKGLNPNTATHGWIGWRSIYVSDPDDNTVEFVCYDPSVLIA